MKTTFIYALNCPFTGQTRYVGKSDNPGERFLAHLAKAYKERCHRANWVCSLLQKGKKPVLEILDEVPKLEWPQWEVAYIEFFREQGFDLVNATAGGEGSNCPSEETRAKRRAAQSGKNHHFFGKKLAPEHCKKLSAAHSGEKHHMFGKHLAPVTCEKIGAAQRGNKNHNFGKVAPPKVRAKMSAWHLGKMHKDNTSGFVGVCWNKHRKKWQAGVSKVYVACFKNLEDAVFARALVMDKHFSL